MASEKKPWSQNWGYQEGIVIVCVCVCVSVQLAMMKAPVGQYYFKNKKIQNKTKYMWRVRNRDVSTAIEKEN